MPYLTLAQPVS